MIDKATVDQILDAADIVDVVSDFVNLKRRGANYVGLCPFHNDKTPSFYVSKSKGICKCFSCGKGGSAVNFIMEHEQMSYYEALKYLANKYHIEVKERELTDEEREAQTERESMLNANDFALKHFSKNLLETTEGQEIGLSYFRERGVSDKSIKDYYLGYSLESKDALYRAATEAGISDKMLFETGLCSKSNYGAGGYDRFKGRVMFPVHNIAGKVIAFGGRTLKHDPAKYVNSPESLIYKKSNELYGLFQAKQAIVKAKKCFLVEGYMDVISMHQSGIENVVASSGTSLTDGQIRLLHRFTGDVTILYDGDAAGIKAALRGIDMLLAEGINIKVLLLPPGEDPDSFAKSHTSSEVLKYISDNEEDFIKFKTRILLEGAANDPIKKSEVISDIVKSIAVIPSQITQAIYVKQCSQMLDIDERIIAKEIAKAMNENAKRALQQKEQQQRQAEKERYSDNPPITVNDNFTPSSEQIIQENLKKSGLQKYESEVIRLIVRYGMLSFCSAVNDTNISSDITVVEYINSEINRDVIEFTNSNYLHLYKIAVENVVNFKNSILEKENEFEAERQRLHEDGIDEIRKSAVNIDDIRTQEQMLDAKVNEIIEGKRLEYRMGYLSSILCSHEDNSVRAIANDMISERYQISKIYKKNGEVVPEYARIKELIPLAINNWKNGIITEEIHKINEHLKTVTDIDEMKQLLEQLQTLNTYKLQFATVLGDRVILPKN